MDKDLDHKKRPHLLLRLLAFLLTLALVLGAVFLVANWQKVNFDWIKRWVAYRSLGKTETGQVESFPYDGGAGSAFTLLGDDLLVCSSTGIRLYSPGGKAYLEDLCHLDDPVALSRGGSALVYDAGGESLYVYRDRQQVFAYTSPGGDAILSASLSAQGRLTVVTQASGLKGAVTVYNDQFQEVLGVNISSRFVTDATLSPDGNTLAVATAGQTGGLYDSQIAFYGLARSAQDIQPDAVCSLGNNTVLALDWSAPQLRAVGESALELLNADGTGAGRYDYGGRYLKGFSLDCADFSALLLGQYRAGTASQLILLDNAGAESAVQPLSDQVLSLTAAGRYVSVLTADALTIYNEALEIYHEGILAQGTRRALQHPNGSVSLMDQDTARLYLPD